MGTISACLTAFYSIRLISLTFLSYPNASKNVYISTHDAPFMLVIIPLTILSLFAIFFGYIAKDLFVGIGSDFASSFTHPSHVSLVEAEFGLPIFIKLLPAIGTFFGAGFAIYLYHVQYLFTIQITDSKIGRNIYRFFNGKYYIDVIYNYYFMYKSLIVGYNISKVLDRGIIELIGPQGLGASLSSSSKNMAKLDTGNLTDYALYIGVSVVGISSLILFNILFEVDIMYSSVTIILIFIAVITNNNLQKSIFKMSLLSPLA
jgi:NADH-ubiquinone oxidoreductase chain 5